MEKREPAPLLADSNAPFVLTIRSDPQMEILPALRAGDLCPTCGNEQLDYDGMLNLSCPTCGPIQGGCFT